MAEAKTHEDPDRITAARNASGEIEAILNMLQRERALDTPEFDRFLLPTMLRRIHALNSVVMSVLADDDDRETEELEQVVYG